MNYLAWIGTGECDPQKDLKQFFVYFALIAGWFLVYWLVRRISATTWHISVKFVAIVTLAVIAIAATGATIFVSIFAFACSR